MIKWLTGYIKFVNQFKLRKSKVRIVLHSLHAIWMVPCIIFHEACHYLAIRIFNATIVSFTSKFLYYNDRELTMFQITFTYAAPPLECIIIAVAPVIGAVILTIVVLLLSVYSSTSYLCLFIYLSSCYDALKCSEVDIKTARSNMRYWRLVREMKRIEKGAEKRQDQEAINTIR